MFTNERRSIDFQLRLISRRYSNYEIVEILHIRDNACKVKLKCNCGRENSCWLSNINRCPPKCLCRWGEIGNYKNRNHPLNYYWTKYRTIKDECAKEFTFQVFLNWVKQFVGKAVFLSGKCFIKIKRRTQNILYSLNNSILLVKQKHGYSAYALPLQEVQDKDVTAQAVE